MFKEGVFSFTKALWSLAVLLVMSNIYTLYLLYDANHGTNPSINFKANDLIPQRRKILEINENNENNEKNNNNDNNNFFEPNVINHNSNNDKNTARSLLQDDFNSDSDGDMFNAVNNDKDLMDDNNNNDLIVSDNSDNNNNNNDKTDDFDLMSLDVICDWSIEYLFNQTINLLYSMKSHNYMEIMNCPTDARAGWRPQGFVPWIFGNQCESWWHRDAVFIMSHLLNKNMKALEYGSGASTIWMSHFVGYVIGIENDQNWMDRMANLTKNLQINNIEIRKFRVHIPYVEIDFSDNPGGFDWSVETGGGIDFISVDGRVRIHCVRQAIKTLKQHGGILLLDNSDRPGDDGINATKIVPDYWLRYDSYNLPQHLQDLPGTRWLENSRTTIWISRHPKCMDTQN